MKLSLIILFFMLLEASCLSQSIKIADYRLGESIKKYDGKLECMENRFVGGAKLPADSCKTFRFLPVRENPIKIGPVTFADLVFVKDDNEIISGIIFLKIYTINDSINAAAQGKLQFMNLKSFVDKILKKKGKKDKTLSREDKNAIYSSFVWKIGKFKYGLNATEILTWTPQTKVAFILNLGVEKLSRD